jgi:hypothetical protein
MKFALGGKIYDEATATALAEWEYVNPSDDAREDGTNVLATLYQTPNGAFFAVHEWTDRSGDERREAEPMTQAEVDSLPSRHSLTLLKDGVWNLPAA